MHAHARHVETPEALVMGALRHLLNLKGHGKLLVEIRDGRISMIEESKRTLIT